MTETTTQDPQPQAWAGVELDTVDEQLAARLVEQARSQGTGLVGPDGLLQRLSKLVLEGALEGELTDHLGYAHSDPAGRNGANSRNGTRPKTVLTEIGPVELEVPRDRDASFQPKIVRKRQRRLVGMDDLVVSLVAKGLTTGEVAAHLAEIYGTQVSRQTISTITVKLRDGQVCNRPIYVALGVTADGERDILGLWAGDGGEGAKYWLHVLTEIKNRGVADVCIVVCDGLTGLPDAISAVWPQAIPRRAWCTCCATASATPAERTGPPSPGICGPSTPPPPRRPRWRRWRASRRPGRPATRPSSGCGSTPGPSSSPS